jgi:hypothetical protein
MTRGLPRRSDWSLSKGDSSICFSFSLEFCVFRVPIHPNRLPPPSTSGPAVSIAREHVSQRTGVLVSASVCYPV